MKSPLLMHDYNIIFFGPFFQNLSNNFIGQDGFDSVCKMLETNTTLKSLNMSGISIPYFRIIKFVRVCSLVGRYFYNVYIVKSLKLCFP